MKRKPQQPEAPPLSPEQLRRRCQDCFGRLLNMGSAISIVDRQVIRAMRRILEVPGGVSDLFIEATLQQMD